MIIRLNKDEKLLVSKDVENTSEACFSLTFIYKESKQNVAAAELTKVLQDTDGPYYDVDNDK
jgi:hypothetical protein